VNHFGDKLDRFEALEVVKFGNDSCGLTLVQDLDWQVAFHEISYRVSRQSKSEHNLGIECRYSWWVLHVMARDFIATLLRRKSLLGRHLP
jgi:hypothetical protein